MKRFVAILLAGLLALTTVATAFADDPFVGNSGNFSGATCPNANNPHCPPHGGG